MQAIGIIYIFVSAVCLFSLAVAAAAIVEDDAKIAGAIVFPVLLIQSVYLPAMFYYNIWATLN